MCLTKAEEGSRKSVNKENVNWLGGLQALLPLYAALLLLFAADLDPAGERMMTTLISNAPRADAGAQMPDMPAPALDEARVDALRHGSTPLVIVTW